MMGIEFLQQSIENKLSNFADAMNASKTHRELVAKETTDEDNIKD